jgi:acetylornithine deacetylase/succinyl-diaminopimelate desuccinylase-like protein
LYGAAQTNLLAVIQGRETALAPLVFNTHLDTVPPGDLTLWTECGGDPFSPKIEGDRIYGLGAADTKLDFVAKSAALLSCRQPLRTTYFIGTFGEEQGLLGAKEMAASGLLPKGALAFVGEPSSLKVVTAHKGLMAFALIIEYQPLPRTSHPVYRATFQGRSAHSSTPRLGVNAIELALGALGANPELELIAIDGGDAVNKVPATCKVLVAGAAERLKAAELKPYENSAVSESIPHKVVVAASRFVEYLESFAAGNGPWEPDLAPPTLTCNPGIIKSSDGQLTIGFELRPPPSLALDVVRAGINEIVRRLSSAFKDLHFALSEDRANPGFRSTADNEVVTLAVSALARAGLSVDFCAKAGCTEAGVYAAAGLQPVVFGPGPSTGVIHAPNEYNLLSEVEGAIRFYRALLDS